MLGWLFLVLFALSFLFAAVKLIALYRAWFSVGSKPWNAYQIALRDDLARFSSRTASVEDARALRVKEERYMRRLERQYARGIFADDIEQRRAETLEQERKLRAAKVYDALRRDAP